MLIDINEIANNLLESPTYENIEKAYNSYERSTIDHLSRVIYGKCSKSKNFELFNRIQDKLQFMRMIDNNGRYDI